MSEYTHRIDGGIYYHERLAPPAFGYVSCEGEAHQRYGLRVRIVRESAQKFRQGQKRVLVQSEPTDKLPEGGYAWVSYPCMLTEIN